jgi:predicted nucleotidyltransferase
MNIPNLTNKIADEFKHFPTVEAIALAGSQSSGILDQNSDIDLYVYTHEIPTLEKRQQIVKKLGASRADMNLSFWDTGDEWFDLETGIEVDVMFWSPQWIEEQLNRVLVQHQASMGYTTCFWRTVKNSLILFDRHGWFAKLQEQNQQPYPPELKRKLISKNHPVLRTVIPSYYNQIKKALGRDDLISVNHRLAAFFASYFDILFAINEVLHPGEKKIVQFVKNECAAIPENLEKQIVGILQTAAIGDRKLLEELDSLIDRLDQLLRLKGFDPDNTLD